MQQENFFVKHAKQITTISIIGIIVCIISIIIVSLISYFNKPSFLSIQFAPSNAVLTLNDGTTLRTGSYEIQPGYYNGTITADNYQSKTVSFEIKPHESNSLIDYLVHISEGLEHYTNNQSSISTLRLIKNDPDVTNFLQKYDQKTSIYSILPLDITWLKNPNDYPTYTVKLTDGNNRPECFTTLCLLVTGPSYNEAEITKALKEHNYNIDDYEVIYEYSPV